jgi:6-phosphogluconolactonase (cycloisomerase 2 family)
LRRLDARRELQNASAQPGYRPGRAFLLAANQVRNNLVVFRIERKTGRPDVGRADLEVANPMLAKFQAVK